MKYLIVRCVEMPDVIDVYRTVVKVSNEPSPAGWHEEAECGYEVYEIKADGSLELIKTYYEEE